MSWSACLRILGAVSSQRELSFSLLRTQRPLGASLTTQALQAQMHSTLSAWSPQDITSSGVGVGVVQQQAGQRIEPGMCIWPCCFVSSGREWVAERLLGVQGSDGRIFWRPGRGQGLPCPPTLLAAARESETGQEKSQLSGGLSGLLEAEEKQAGAIGNHCSRQGSALPIGITSPWPEMTWPGQWDIAAGERKGWLDKQVAAGAPSLPSHSQGSHACCSCPPMSPLWVWAQEVRS